jgi:ABC-type lipoprotein export system ATPase subunit
VAALRGLTLEVGAGERVVVHGPNGSGKTTLMRVLIGERTPSAGIVNVCGVDLTAAGDRDRARLRCRSLGLVDQHHGRNLRPELPVADNVALQTRLGGGPQRSARARAQELLDRLGLGALAERYPATLSGGEAQRVAVCAAVAHGPTLVLADEPTAELDRESADGVYDLLATAARSVGAALLVVSHDERAARIADRIVRIRDGRLSEEWGGDHDGESLVVDDRGWVRLPEPLRISTGISRLARASSEGGAIVLSATTGGRPAGPIEAGSTSERPPPSEVVATLSRIIVDRGGRRVLDDQDLELRSGSLTVVQGRSGSGKTTLLRILCGLERPDAGSVTLLGHDLAELDRIALAALRRRHIGVASQATALLETLDVVENLRLIRLLKGLPEADAAIDGWISASGMGPLRHRQVRALSGGERQRLSVIRVLAASPDVAVLDEPTSRQDEAHAELLARTLADAAAGGMAILAATHDPVLVSAADTVVDLGR